MRAAKIETNKTRFSAMALLLALFLTLLLYIPILPHAYHGSARILSNRGHLLPHFWLAGPDNILVTGVLGQTAHYRFPHVGEV